MCQAFDLDQTKPDSFQNLTLRGSNDKSKPTEEIQSTSTETNLRNSSENVIHEDESTILQELPSKLQSAKQLTNNISNNIIHNDESTILQELPPKIQIENRKESETVIRHTLDGVPKVTATYEMDKPKFRFLRRGEGLKRYKQSSEDILRSRKTQPSTKGKWSNPRIAENDKIRPDLITTNMLQWKAKDVERSEHRAEVPASNVITKDAYKKLLDELKIKRDDHELQVFEYYEEKADHSSFCSTTEGAKLEKVDTPKLERMLQNNFKVRFQGVDSTLDESDYQEVVNVPTNIRPEYSETKFPDETEWSSTLDETSEEEDENREEEGDDESKEDEKGESNRQAEVTIENHDDTDECPDVTFKSDLLKKRLLELENEIQTFRNENANLIKQRQQLAAEKRKLQKERTETEKSLKEEKIRNTNFLEEERKKIAKDKMVFEKYVKDLKNQPTKKEREEIIALKNEVKTLKEEIRIKETKHGAFVARLRTQIRQMTKELEAVKIQCDKLGKENKRLTSVQKRQGGISNTKVLHEINRNLSKILPKAMAENRLKELMEPEEAEESDESEEEVDEEESPHIPKSAYFEKENDQNAPNQKTQSLIGTNQKSSTRSCVDTLRDVMYPPVTYRKNENIEDLYKKTFQEPSAVASSIPTTYQLSSRSGVEKQENVHSDGTKVTKYSNGNIKTVTPDGIIKLTYYNGDLKETTPSGEVKYYYAKTKTTHVTFPDGFEVLEFPNGQIENRFKDGRIEIIFPNGYKKLIDANRNETWFYSDGTKVINRVDGEKIIELPNGQKEIHNTQHMVRSFYNSRIYSDIYHAKK